MTADPEVRAGWVDPELEEEFPGLRVEWCEVPAAEGSSPPALRARLRELSDRLRGPQALALRARDVPHAYRVFFRHIGLDPDETRTPVEALVVERLTRGGFPTKGRVGDALAIACLETGVPVWALDAGRLAGAPGVRPARDGEQAGRGRLVLADAERTLAVLFDPPPVPEDARRFALVSVVVPNVPALFSEEALWIAAEALAA